MKMNLFKIGLHFYSIAFDTVVLKVFLLWTLEDVSPSNSPAATASCSNAWLFITAIEMGCFLWLSLGHIFQLTRLTGSNNF